MNISLHEIAALVNGTVQGDSARIISSLSTIDAIVAGSLVFADSNKNLQLAENSVAAAILVPAALFSEVKPVIQVINPIHSFIQLMHLFYPAKKHIPKIHPTAVIAKDIVLGKEIYIGPYVVIESGAQLGDECIINSHVHIGENVSIGSHTLIYPQVVIYDHCRIGSRVIIHASSVIGSDGFGYTKVNNQHIKIPHMGQVIIGDDVEIGANTVIDRAPMGTTVIGDGTKIDNLVQIAHGVKLGKHNILCALTGIAGSTISGDYVTFAANVGVSDHVRIDDNVTLCARAGVPPNKHLRQGNLYIGNPARPMEKALKNEFAVSRIPFILKKLKELNKRMAELSQSVMEDS